MSKFTCEYLSVKYKIIIFDVMVKLLALFWIFHHRFHQKWFGGWGVKLMAFMPQT